MQPRHRGELDPISLTKALDAEYIATLGLVVLVALLSIGTSWRPTRRATSEAVWRLAHNDQISAALATNGIAHNTDGHLLAHQDMGNLR